MDIKRLVAVVVSGLLLTSCASNEQKTQALVATSNASIKLAEAASTVSQASLNTAAIQRATTPGLVTKSLPQPLAPGLDTLASVDWSGPIGPLVKKIAQAGGYQMRVLGVAPAIPVLVSMNVKNVPLEYILRDADYQAGSQANVVVLPQDKIIEIRYARN